ncbi:restriction endonuclease subunit S [Yersinia enterocolitica]|uniref:restriction endonuclease subunit S n=1 Tax=Yersinia enterocolitica TaxID=630 RepID=UPI00313B45C3
MAVEKLITQHIDTWTSALRTRSTAGRGSNGKIDLYGIKKLRELILELAVRGKLVPQDPNDEPASELLKRITAEKAELVKQGKIKKQKPLPEISEDEKPFELPEGWEWVRISEAGHDWGQKTPDCEFTYIDVGSINKELGIIHEPETILAKNAPSRAKKIVKKGTVIYSTVRPYLLNIAIIEQEFTPEPIASTAFAIIHPFAGMFSNYIYYYLRSPTFIKYVEGCQTGIAYPAINDKQFFTGLIAIPPSCEQDLIVNKVGELMSLCDQLEQQSLTSLEAHSQLVETLLSTLTDSQNAEELAENWARISQHFDTLFTTEASIDALKQTILQLAVMGKLVPQDPNDEPASELLKRIEQEKAQLVKEGKIKKQKPLLPISDDEKPFKLPEGWVWARVGDILSLKNGYAFKSNYFVDSKRKYILTTPGNFYETGGFRYRGDKTKYYDGPLDAEFMLSSGDLIIPMTEQAPGLLGSAAFIPNDEYIYLHNQRLGKLELYYEGVTSNFIFWFFNSQLLRVELARTCTGTTVRHTSPDRVLNALVPVVPSNEQHRITAKINKLMTLCDTLKSRLQLAQQTQFHLADALTDAALN